MAKKIALLIGNSGFRDEALGALAAPDDDVVALRDILRTEACGFETIPMIGAGLIETQAAITDLFENRRRDDTLLIYYTGHGLRDDRGDLYLALPQTDLKRLRATALRSGFIREEMERSASARQVMILDCCHSGAVMAEGVKRTDHDDLVKTDFVDPVGYGKFVLTACSAQESAFERDGASIFTRHLVDGLRDGAAAPDKNNITIRDVYDYLSRRVPDEQSAMMPRIWASEQVRDLVIASNLNPRPVVPDDLVKLLWHTDPNLAFSGAARLISLMEGADEQFTADITAALQQRMDQPETLSYLVAQQIIDALVPGSQHDETGRVAELEADREKLRKSHAHEMAGLARQIATIEADRDAAIAASERAEQQRVAETTELTTGIRTLKEQFDAEQRRLQDAVAEAQQSDDVEYTPSRIPFAIACISAGVAIAVSIYAFLFSSTEMSPGARQEIEEQIKAENAEALKQAQSDAATAATERDQAKEQVARLKQDLKNQESATAQSISKLDNVKGELAQTTEKLEISRSEAASAISERGQAKEHVARLKHDLKNQESATAQSRSELADVKGELAQTTEKLETSQSEAASAMSERDQAKEHVARLEQDLEGAQKKAAELLQAARTSADRIVVRDAELKVEIDDLRARLEDAQTALNELKPEMLSKNAEAESTDLATGSAGQQGLNAKDPRRREAEARATLAALGRLDSSCNMSASGYREGNPIYFRDSDPKCNLASTLDRFQGQMGLPQTGEADQETIDRLWQLLDSLPIPEDAYDRYSRRHGPAVTFMQAHLLRIGIEPGPVDGVFGAMTRAAIVEFQKLSSFQPTAEWNDETLRALKAASPTEIADLREQREDERKRVGQSLAIENCPKCPEMVRIPGGTFLMGSPADEIWRGDDEQQHEVTVQDFAIARTEVTFDQWQLCVDGGGCQSNPRPYDEGWGRGSRPVINVSWDDAQEYISWLNHQVKGPKLFRLPTEAEWEFAARAETITPFAFGNTISKNQANYDSRKIYGPGVIGGFRRRTVPVGDLDAENSWGLRHMHGNVWEWVEDVYERNYSRTSNDGSAHVIEPLPEKHPRLQRGGSWLSNPEALRSANRHANSPSVRYNVIGFRPARTLAVH